MSHEAQRLISQKLKEKGLSESFDKSVEYKYVCMDTGMFFESFDGHAVFSPYTGSKNISEVQNEEVNPSSYMEPSALPSNQTDAYSQNPLQPNPAPSQPGSSSWMNSPVSPNPAPDAQNRIGADDADPSGYVPYPGNNVPPHKEKKPEDRTDAAPAGSK